MEIVTNSDEGHYKTALAFSLAQFFFSSIFFPQLWGSARGWSSAIKEQNRWEISSLEQNYKVTYHTITSL